MASPLADFSPVLRRLCEITSEAVERIAVLEREALNKLTPFVLQLYRIWKPVADPLISTNRKTRRSAKRSPNRVILQLE